MLAKDTLEEFKLECELRRLTPSYINAILRCIRAYFRYATEEAYLL